jgi:dinuclear metal center YbgI/SA1388 family protein
LLFRPLKSVTPQTEVERCVQNLIKSRINLYSAHTNLDFTRGGTSFAIADVLGLHDVDFLSKPYRLQKKIVTFVPVDYVDRVAHAMTKAGAGRIGNYEECSFRTQGEGTFRGNKKTTPAIGRLGQLEQVHEIRLEMATDQCRLDAVIEALRHTHPYEEVAYDVYSLENRSQEYGMGIIGELPHSLSLKQFFATVKRALGSKALRHSADTGRKILRVAACGGSGSELLEEAIAQGADAFVTADVKYHSFGDAKDRIALIDAGHYETENLVIASVIQRLKHEIKQREQRIPVFAAQTSRNPVHYV